MRRNFLWNSTLATNLPLSFWEDLRGLYACFGKKKRAPITIYLRPRDANGPLTWIPINSGQRRENTFAAQMKPCDLFIQQEVRVHPKSLASCWQQDKPLRYKVCLHLFCQRWWHTLPARPKKIRLLLRRRKSFTYLAFLNLESRPATEAI